MDSTLPSPSCFCWLAACTNSNSVGPKVYSLHTSEVGCIGKGKAHKPYEFGVKVSVATTIDHATPVRHPCEGNAGSLYDGHTLATVIPDMEALIGNVIARLLAGKGYRGHDAPPESSGSSSPARSEE